MPREFSRRVRVNAQLQQVLANKIRALSDPRTVGVTVTEVDASPDLRQARVKVSVMGDDDALVVAVRALNKAAGKLRHEVGQALALRLLPQLRFEADHALREGDRIASLIRKVVTEDAGRAQGRGDEAAPDTDA